MKKRYKALISDVDGTLIINSQNAVPSEKVKEAIKKASNKLHVGIATSRPLFLAKPILEMLQLTGPSVITGGAQIIQSENCKILQELAIPKKDFNKIKDLILKYSSEFLIQDTEGPDIEYSKDYVPQNPLEIGVFIKEIEDANNLIKELKTIDSISAHLVPSWDNTLFVAITHSLATKQHGIFEVAKILGIESHEIIGIGDGYNDFPLLMACGLKVAMGNAVSELKEIADYIAPPVEEDGVAHVIEKFVL